APTAALLARRARERAVWLAPGVDVLGVGCTASLRSDRPKKGDHRIHAAAATAQGVRTLSLTLAKEQRSRQGEEEVAARRVVNADKPPLSEAEVRRRVAQLLWKAPAWLTRAPTFVEKARLFPGAVFVVGVDTAVRIVQPRFYGGSEEGMRTAMGEIRERGCR